MAAEPASSSAADGYVVKSAAVAAPAIYSHFGADSEKSGWKDFKFRLAIR